MNINLKVLITIVSCLFLLSCTKGIAGNEPDTDGIFNNAIVTPLLSPNFTSALFFNFTQNNSGQPNEGFAIYGNYAFSMYATGVCNVYDVNGKKFVSSFHLGSYSSTNHANVADFGVEFPEGNTDFPAIYISECTGSIKRCFVESITTNGSQLIQTITPNSSKLGRGYTDWAVDRENDLLYCLTEVSGIGDTNYNVLVFRLPQLSEGSDVTLTDADIIDSWAINENGTTQGLYISNGYMYFPMSGGSGLNGCVLYIMDLMNQSHEVTTINLGANFTNSECEDLYLYNNTLLISFQGGGVYAFKNSD